MVNENNVFAAGNSLMCGYSYWLVDDTIKGNNDEQHSIPLGSLHEPLIPQQDSSVNPIDAADHDAAVADENLSLLENIDGLVLVIFPQGRILHVSSWCCHMGYSAGDLYKASIDSICHPLDVPNLQRQLRQSLHSSNIEALIRIKHCYDGYTWFQFHGSVWVYGARKMVTLVGLPQPDLHLDRQVLAHGGELNWKDVWLRLSMSGLVLTGFGTSRTPLGLLPNDFIGSTFFTLIHDSRSRRRLQERLRELRDNEVFEAILSLAGPKSNQFQAKVTFYASTVRVHSKPYFALARIKFIKSLPYNYATRNEAAEVVGITADQSTVDNLFSDLDPNMSGLWQSDLRNLQLENRRLQAEVDQLVQRQGQRRRCKKEGFVAADCANCHTRVTPEWRKGPGGKRSLCNACGLRWAKRGRSGEGNGAGDGRI